MFAVLPAGLARIHNANPASSIHVQNIFTLPDLLSGIAELNLKWTEIDVLDNYFKKMLQSLMKLPDKCPQSVVYFLNK